MCNNRCRFYSHYGRARVLRRERAEEGGDAELSALPPGGGVRIELAGAHEEETTAAARRRSRPSQVRESALVYGPQRRPRDVQERPLPQADRGQWRTVGRVPRLSIAVLCSIEKPSCPSKLFRSFL